MARKQSFSDKFWHDKHGQFVVAQKPNVFLWVWLFSFAMSILLSPSTFKRDIVLVGGISILIWAALELGWGVNYFRRTLGLCVLLLYAVSHIA